MTDRPVRILLTGSPAEARLPPVLTPATRSVASGEDAFLPTGYLQPTGSFDMKPVSRGTESSGASEQVHEAADHEVLVLELADGSTLITSAERLRSTLARTRPEMVSSDGSVRLDLLNAEGAALQRGFGSAVTGMVGRVYSFVVGASPDAIIDAALGGLVNKAELGVSWLGTKALMRAIEDRLDRQPGLYRWAGAAGKPGDLEAVDLRGLGNPPIADPARPMLVFVHGTGSSTLGSFGDLRTGDRDLWPSLERQFPGGVFAYEHRTLSQSPIENAIELLLALPVGAHVSLASHSRGGLVADLLCLGDFDALIDQYRYAFPATGDPDPAESQRVLGELHDAHAEQRAQLRALAALLRDRRPVIQRYVRAASPANGTKLASGNFDVFLSGLLTLIGAVPFFYGSPFYSSFKRVVIEIAKNRTNAHLVPGIEAMLPDSPMARLLRDAPVRDGIAMAVIAGDIEGGNLLKRLGVLLTDFLLFDNDDNDLVVNTTSMLAGIASKANARVLFDRGSNVSHFRYFANVDTRSALRDWFVEPEPRALDVFRPLPSAEDYATALAQAARSSRSAVAADLPVVLVLPGVMGSHLQVDRADRVWFDPLDIADGGLAKIAWGQPGVEAEELFDMFYGKLCRELSSSHRVERFPYDWRQPLDVLADRLGERLDALLKGTQQPIRLLAHSMGGLVVRACIHKRRPVMDALMRRPGARLVMLGTPHQGAHSMVENLLGKGSTLRTLVRLDLKHDMQQVLDIVSDFRGALSLLPKPGFVDAFQGQSDGGAFHAYQKADTWALLKSQNSDLWFGDQRCGTPAQKVLDAANWLWQQDGLDVPKLPADYESRSIYVCGVARNTPCGVRLDGGRLKMVGTTRGDGTVTWDSGRIDGIGTYYYMPAAHGDLLSTEAYFGALTELIGTGATTGLPSHPPATRSLEDDQPVRYDAGPPSVDDADALTRGLMGGSLDTRVPRPLKFRLEVAVRAMDLRSVRAPIMVGQYEQDPVAGPQEIIDRDLLLGGLSERYNLGLYAGALGSAVVVLNGGGRGSRRGAPLGGAIVTGLGTYDGSLGPAQLADAVRFGALRYLLQVSDLLGPDEREVPLASLLIGYNSAVNLTVAGSVEALVRGVLEANARFAATTRRSIRISRLEIVELYLDTAIEAAYALREVGRRLRSLASQNATLLVCRDEIDQNSSVRPRLYGDQRQSYWPRLMITEVDRDDDAGATRATNAPARTAIGERLKFLYVGQRARAESVVLQRQPGLIEKLVASQIGSSQWREEFGRMLFQLMVPHDFKDAARTLERVVLVVDGYTANLPWELMLADDSAQRSDAFVDASHQPLALRSAVVRQFATASFRRQVRSSPVRTALVIGNPSSLGFAAAFLDATGQPHAQPPSLSGAEAEAQAVAGVLRNCEYQVTELHGERVDATAVLGTLYQRPWRLLHISAHGVFNLQHADGSYRSGVVLSDGLLITAAEIAAMEVVPELVFLNCCHLATVDIGRSGNKLAASISRELIDIGVRCIIVAGWAVDDAIAQTFGEVFYRELLFGAKPFGLAVYEARKAAWTQGKGADITWGAFQAYGDPGWMADPHARYQEAGAKPRMFVAVNEVCDELVRRKNDLMRRGDDLTPKQADAEIAEVDDLVAKRCPVGWRRRPELLVALGDYFREIGHLGRAYQSYIDAVQTDELGNDVSVRILDHLAFIEAQMGDWLAEYGLDGDMAQWVSQGERSFRLALRRLDVLDSLAGLQDDFGDGKVDAQGDPDGRPAARPNGRRDAMRGSAWKRKASLHARLLLKGRLAPLDADQAARDMRDAIQSSIAAYKRAEGHPGGADFDIYRALNRLTLDALTEWASPAERDNAIALAQRCRQLSEERAQNSDDPWDVLMPGDALLAERLIDGSLGRHDDIGNAVLDELAAAFGAALQSISVKPAVIYGLVNQLEILARFCDALSLAQFRDEALSRTADRLQQLMQSIEPRRTPRSDRPLADTAEPPSTKAPAEPAAAKKVVAKKAVAKKAAAKKAVAKKVPAKKKAAPSKPRRR